MPVKKFKLGDKVYHVTDPNQDAGIVTGITERPGFYIYLVQFCGYGQESACYDIELTEDKNYNY